VNKTRDDSGVIVIIFPYNPLVVKKVKTFSRHNWYREKNCWSFSNIDGTLGKISKVFKNTVRLLEGGGV
jgi:hypothetical protein